LEYLRSDPQFQQMRSIIQANPQLLPHFIEQLRSTNPAIFDLISSNSAAFVRLMQEGLDGPGVDSGSDASAPTNVVHVTESERAAIERLEQLGFDRARAVEAFFACDKNEELAANFLLEHINDEEL
jgi:UV excision repair protein RAD23